jgi:carbamoyl-phosphate synthase large subunit
VDLNIPLLTNARLASAYITAFCKIEVADLDIMAWNEY